MTEQQQAFVDSVNHNLKGINHASPGGSLESCDDCPDYLEYDHPDHLGVSYEADEGGFSWSSCDGCGSHLGGNRSVGHGWLPEEGVEDIVIHLELCDDCVCYLANGDLPTSWE